MRILFITNSFPPDSLEGTQLYTSALAAGLQQSGHVVSVVCIGQWTEGIKPFNGITADNYLEIPVTRLHLNWLRTPDPTRYLYNNPIVADFVRELVREFQPDIVHVTSCYKISASVIPAVKELGIPVILSLTDFWFICPRIKLIVFIKLKQHQ